MINKAPQMLFRALCIIFSFTAAILCLVMLLEENNQREGIVHIKFGVLRPRGTLSDTLGSLAQGATSFLHAGTAVVGSAAAHATSAAASAIGTAESTFMQALPRNLTVGTEFICTAYATHSDCSVFSESDGLLGASRVLIAGRSALIGLSVLTLFSLAAGLLGAFWNSVIVSLVSLLIHGLAILFAVAFFFGVAVLSSLSSELPGASAETGEVFRESLATLVCCCVSFGMAIATWLF
ncbi:hypothetical protein PG999_005592 [Apiospora kogelbergensis]|uniref:Uncharacterized protein n=1 Tax=Apiospora kogelbergensis TaxID=1337665 RepID=A0AAW0R2M9_9PEZI